MRGYFKVCACLLVCLFLAGCSQAAKLTSYVPYLNSPDRDLADSKSQSAGKAQVCVLDAATTYVQPVAAPSATPSDKAPAVEIPETSHDFGKLGEEGEAVHEFSVRNVGKAVLNIKKVLPS